MRTGAEMPGITHEQTYATMTGPAETARNGSSSAAARHGDRKKTGEIQSPELLLTRAGITGKPAAREAARS